MSTTARYRSDARHFPPICSAAASCTYVQQGRQLDERSRWQRRFVRNPNQMGIKFDPDRARVEDTTIREGGIVRREKTSGDEEGRMRCHTTRRHLSSSRSFLTPATSSLRFAGKLSSSKVSGFARKFDIFDTSRALACFTWRITAPRPITSRTPLGYPTPPNNRHSRCRAPPSPPPPRIRFARIRFIRARPGNSDLRHLIRVPLKKDLGYPCLA